MLTRSSRPPLHIEPEIEKFARRNRKLTRLQRIEEEMAEQREEETLQNYFSLTMGVTDSIRRPRVQAANFELKPGLINMIQNSGQFGGLPSEDPLSHLRKFL